MSDYKRVMITGVLITKENFHIGTGGEDTHTASSKPVDGEEPATEITETNFNQLCLDHKGKPYIPASSLRGYLRHVILNQLGDDAVKSLFGLARQHKDKEEMGNSGLVRIQDCCWDSAGYDVLLNSQTSIDPVTTTAKHHQLSTHAVIPPDSRFTVHIELDNASEEQVRQILQALQTFGEEHNGKLGKGKSTGQGECYWLLGEKGVQGLSKKSLKKWLNNEKKQRSLESYFGALDIASTLGFNTPYTKQTLLLTLNSPLLINDPQAVNKREQDKTNSDETADLIFKQQNNQVIIPGSTLKGWARARRILLTLLQKPLETEKIADYLLDQIFGSTQQQSRLYFNDAKVGFKESEIHLQTFNAIDRFTGGVKDGALYNVEAIWSQQAFSVQLHQIKELEDWMKLLLLYILRDSMEGDLILGWGKSKGYGRMQLSLADYSSWEEFYQSIEPADLQRWDSDLQEKLKGDKT